MSLPCETKDRRKILRHWLGSACVLLVVFTGGVAADRMLGTREAREALARLTGDKYPTKQIRIRQVIPGFTPNEALVEAEINATFKFKREANGWRPTEVRLGDQQWESLDALTKALAQVRHEHTDADLHALAAGLERYRARQGGYVVADNIVKLTDVLAPDYVNRVIRRDGWNHQMLYSGTRTSFRLQSFGPDGKPNTGDDVILSAP